jgi:hypothetical protein
VVGNNVGRNGMWALPGGNAVDTLQEENAPKGKSQERCRCERKPARLRGEKTVEGARNPEGGT